MCIRDSFTTSESVVYHFRISTQAGVNTEMPHPFPLSNQPARLRKLDLRCRIGVAHNGVIQLTSDPDNDRYSDTAIFITDYLTPVSYTHLPLHDDAGILGIECHCPADAVGLLAGDERGTAAAEQVHHLSLTHI